MLISFRTFAFTLLSLTSSFAFANPRFCEAQDFDNNVVYVSNVVEEGFGQDKNWDFAEAIAAKGYSPVLGSCFDANEFPEHVEWLEKNHFRIINISF